MTSSTADLRMLKEEKLRRLYRKDPAVYARQVLGVTWWEKQLEVARSVAAGRKTLVKASHSIGKTHLAGGLVNWFFDSFAPSITLTTAPTKDQVEDLLWKEVRVQRGGRPGLMPKSPRLELAEDHFAVGYTARDDNAFQGRHEERVLIIFDEATGIDGQFWEAAEGMLTGEDCHWLAILNPTDTASRAYEEEQGGDWEVITVSAMDHPNIAADLEGRPAPFPKAVRLVWLEERIKKWCTPISPSDRKAKDIEFPPESGLWYRPGPLFEGRVLGRWPSQGSTSVWTEALWEAALVWQPTPKAPIELGCDVARFGDDFTSMIARRGACVLHHETHNGWGTEQTAGRLKQLAREFSEPGEDPERVQIKVDDDGVGGGVYDQRGKFRFVRMNAGGVAMEPEEYPNRRSEFWFATAERADKQMIDMSRLSRESKSLLKRQAMAPKWKVDSKGRRVVEPKDETKKRIGRSPDDMDAFNLAFAPPPPSENPIYSPTMGAARNSWMSGSIGAAGRSR
jgi:hypothetical protein